LPDSTSPIIHSANDYPDTVLEAENATLYANVSDGWTLDSVWFDFNGANYTATQGSGSLTPQRVFFEDFESATFGANWTTDGSWEISATHPFSGFFTTEADNTVGGNTLTSRDISALGYNDVELSYYVRTENFAAGDSLSTEWYDGTSWNLLENLTSTIAYTGKQFNLGEGLDDIKVRFTCTSTGTTKHCHIEDVNVTGVPIIEYTEIYSVSVNSTGLNGLVNYTVHANDTENNLATPTISNITVTPAATITGTVKDPNGNEINTTFEILNSDNTSIYNANKKKHSKRVAKGLYKVKITPFNHTIQEIEIASLNLTTDTSGLVDIGLPNSSQDFLFSVNPLVNDTMTIVANGTALPNSTGFRTLSKCTDWNFATGECTSGNWTVVAALLDNNTYNFQITGADPGFTETVSSCVAEDSAAKGSFGGVCDDPTGALLEADDSLVETHEFKKQGPNNLWGGIRIQSVNTSITNCAAITKVDFCYEWWDGATRQPVDCYINVSNGVGFANITDACPGPTVNPGVTCRDVTADLSWTCDNFFGPTGTRAFAQSEVEGANPADLQSWDVFYFNVTYGESDTNAPGWSNNISFPTSPATYSEGQIYQFNVTWTDPSISTVLIEQNFTGTFTNISLAGVGSTYNYTTELGVGTYTWKQHANDTSGNKNTTNNFTYTVNQATTTLNLSASPSNNETYGTTTNVSCAADNTQVALTLTRDGVSVSNPDVGVLAATTYNYTCTTPGNTNYTSDSAELFVTISKAASNVNLTLNNTDGNVTILQFNSINLTAVSQSGEIDIDILRDGVSVASGASPLTVLETFNGMDPVNITAVQNETENYTSSIDTHFVIIQDGQPPAVFDLIPVAGTEYNRGDTIEIQANATDSNGISYVSATITYPNSTTQTITLTNISGTDKYNNTFTIPILSGQYNVSYFANDTYNNINNTESTNFVAVDLTSPAWTNNISFPASPNTYTEGQNYEFNVTWTDDVALDTVLIEHNFAGSFANFSVTNVGDVYAYTSELGVGTYTWRMHANDTNGNTNTTNDFSYTVVQASPNINVSVSPSSTVNYGTTTNVSCTADSTQPTLTLTQNGTTVSNPHAIVLAAGTHNYTCTTPGNTNYTSDSQEVIVTVNKATGLVNLTLDGTDGNLTIGQFSTVNLTSVIETGVGNIDLYRNGTLIDSGASPLENLSTFNSIGLYNITSVLPATENYTASIDTHFLQVNDAEAPVVFDLVPSSGTNYNVTDTIFIQANVTDNFGVDTVYATITYPNSTTQTITLNNIASTDKYNNTFTIPLLIGQYNISYFANDTDSNVNNTETTFFIANDATNPEVFDVAPTQGTSYELETEIEIQANVTDDIEVDAVIVNITYPNSSIQSITLGQIGSTSRYNNTFTIPLLEGQYNLTYFANDTSSNFNSTETTFFAGNKTYTSIFSDELNTTASFSFSTDVFAPYEVIEINNTQVNSTYLITGSFNLEKITGGGTNDVFIEFKADGAVLLQDQVGHIKTKNQALATGSKTANFKLETLGIHNVTISFRREGSGSIDMTNPSFIFGRPITAAGSSTPISITKDTIAHSSTAYTPIANLNLSAGDGSDRHYAVKMKVNSSANTVVEYYLNSTDGSSTSPLLSAEIIDNQDTQIISMFFLENNPPENFTLYGRSSTGAQVTTNYSIVSLKLRDTGNRFINSLSVENTSTNINEEITLGAGTHLLASTNQELQNGTSLFMRGFAGVETLSGPQQVEFKLNITEVSENNCVIKKVEDLSASNSVNNLFANLICTNLTPGQTYTKNLYVTVQAGETINVTDEGVSGFESSQFEIQEIFLADEENPVVVNLVPTSGTSFDLESTVQIGANITDNIAVDKVSINLTLPNGTIEQYTLNLSTGNFYNTSYFIPTVPGNYTVLFIANDTSNNLNTTESTFFVGNDSVIPSVFDLVPAAGTNYNVTDTVSIQANVTDNVEVGTVQATITYPNSTTQTITLSQVGATDKYNNTFTIPLLIGY
jgi:hypothetical protein